MPEEKRERGGNRGGRLLSGCLAGFAVLILGSLGLVNLVLLPLLDAKLAQAVRREFHLPPDARVQIQRGLITQTLHGYLPRFTVKGSRAVIDELQVENLEFMASGIDFNMRGILDGEKAQLSDLESARLKITVSEAQLQERIAPLVEQEGFKEPVLKIEEDGVKLTVKKKVKLIGSVKLSAKGRFIVDGTDSVRFQARELELGPANIGIAGLGLDIKEALPVIDLGGFTANINVDEVHTSEGHLHISAHTGRVRDAEAGADAGKPAAESAGED